MVARQSVHIGTSGYQYEHWRGVLYEKGLPRRLWLERYAREFDTLEVNNTFYGLPATSTFERWKEVVPRGFLFALKLSRYVTHMKKLEDPVEPVSRFLGRAARLGKTLGPILVQLPPTWKRDRSRLQDFLDVVSTRHRWAVEFRDESWLRDEIFQVLADHLVALVIHDLIERHPRTQTADFVYLRFHGHGYRGRYSPQKLGAEARWLRSLGERGTRAFVFFNNDEHGFAVQNACALKRHLERR